MDQSPSSLQRTGRHIVLPGLVTAHSHAFQRALRGRTQQRATAAGSFWTWRDLMYRLVTRLDPESIYALSHFAYIELALSGVTAIGEFHYLHHDQGGRPYADRLAMADAVIQAAKDVGIRLTLIRTAYLRGGYQQELAPAQQRFADRGIEQVIADVEALQARHAGDPQIRIGVAAHSIRAVPLADVVTLAAFARAQELPFHMHVAEQRRELAECQAEYGCTPVALLADADVLAPNFVAVHATHLADEEIAQLGAARAAVCLCRTTERDLGDGLPRTAALMQAGVRICVGVDSHCSADAFEEIRAVELDERSRTEQRVIAATAPELLEMGTAQGAACIGQADAWWEDAVWLDGEDAALVGATTATLADSVIFGATPRAVDSVWVAGNCIVAEGAHAAYDRSRRQYLAALQRLVN